MYYSDGAAKATAFLAAYIAVIAAIVAGLAPLNVLWFGQAMNIPVILCSKVFHFVLLFCGNRKMLYYILLLILCNNFSSHKLIQIIPMEALVNCLPLLVLCCSLAH